ncbi:hypothetical protein ALQ64_03396 [Pseudomonas cannabina]|uniref:Uncharacterized protein n=2 Tax=Pseudomonas cannabina TaxID=86840 RepID=A0A3M3M6C0_PSECA|nr:hypothetical protein ALQ64_03396 [Pseudomonas cannabina]
MLRLMLFAGVGRKGDLSQKQTSMTPQNRRVTQNVTNCTRQKMKWNKILKSVELENIFQ